MSLAETETETANVESMIRAKPEQRFGLTGLKQFARVGLDLKIGEFRLMCQELCNQGMGATPHDVADVLFNWMIVKLDAEPSK